MNYYFEVLKKYAVLRGRASREEYWTFTLVNFAIGAAAGFIAGIFSAKLYFAMSSSANVNFSNIMMAWMATLIIFAIFGLLILIPGISVSVRRLHDIGHSGWWSLFVYAPVIVNLAGSFFKNAPALYFLNLIAAIILIVWLVFALKGSQPGINKYGPNPKESLDSKKPAM